MEPKTQKEQLSIKLKALSVDVAPKDKKEAAETIQVSQTTIDRYLRGDVRDNEMAAQIVEFMLIKIAARAQRASLTGNEVAA